MVLARVAAAEFRHYNEGAVEAMEERQERGNEVRGGEAVLGWVVLEVAGVDSAGLGWVGLDLEVLEREGRDKLVERDLAVGVAEVGWVG